MTIPTTIAVATGNAHKIEEIQSILSGTRYEVVSAKDLLGGLDDVFEDGETFAENALKKVIDLPLRDGVAYLAEDSGIEVHALDGRPGIHSARYGGDGVSTTEQCRLLLSELDGKENRRANYICSAVLRLENGEILTYEGKLFGEITDDLYGDGGFGYDPIFIPEGYSKTCGQISAKDKHAISHRGRAIRGLFNI